MIFSRAHDPLTVIGIDCAAQPEDAGFALGVHTADGPRIEQVWSGKRRRWDKSVDQVAERIDDTIGTSILIALDAPLGWPQALGEALLGHSAGAAPGFEADEMFHRRTDDVVRERLDKRPLEVGADKIARASHRALWFLDQVRERTGLEVPLAWEPGPVTGVKAIEVYPAATLITHGHMPEKSYKSGVQARRMRQCIVSKMAEDIEFDREVSCRMVENDDLLDAALCVVAGVAFVRDDVVRPSSDEMERAKREGWIWFKPRD